MFRSRLEARWAAFFDLLCWRWKYEPIDLEKWTPDFWVEWPCKHSECSGSHSLLAEIKPHTCPSEFDGHPLWDYRPDDGGFGPMHTDGVVGLGLDPSVSTEWEMSHGIGFGTETLERWLPANWDDFWKEAGNEVQWKPSRHKASAVPATEQMAIGPLAERCLECLIALNEKHSINEWVKIRGMWRSMRKLFCCLPLTYNAITEGIETGRLDWEKLAIRVPNAEVNIGKLLRRVGVHLERGGKRVDASLIDDDDYDVVWQHCERDILRWRVREKIRWLDECKCSARDSGDHESLLRYSRQRRNLLRFIRHQTSGK